MTFPNTFNNYITSEAAHIEGTANMLDEKIAWPINHVTIDCYKTQKYCEVRQIVLTTPHETPFAQTYGIMDLGTDIYKITRWEDGYIDAVPIRTATCRTVSLNYNFNRREFFETTRNAGQDCKILDKVLDKLPKPRITQIVDGTTIIGNLRLNSGESLRLLIQ